MEVRKLYYEDCHLSRFTARVESCEETDGGWAVTLDATAFYPEGGGQASDTGTLGGVKVLHAGEAGEQVIHLCGGPLTVGETVEGQIDYARRFDLMQQHTGEHMVSGVIHRRYGAHNVGFHMGIESITIDFDVVIPPEDLPAIETEVNRKSYGKQLLDGWGVRIDATHVKVTDVFSVAENAEKLLQNRVYNVNGLREKLDDELLPFGWADEYVMTKNAEVITTEGDA